MKRTNYIFLSKYKGDAIYSYSFENYEDAERHITQMIFMDGAQVRRSSKNTISIKVDEDYSIVVVKRVYEVRELC